MRFILVSFFLIGLTICVLISAQISENKKNNDPMADYYRTSEKFYNLGLDCGLKIKDDFSCLSIYDKVMKNK